MLKTTGGMLAAATAASGVGAATGQSRTKKTECKVCPQPVTETESYGYVATGYGGQTRVFKVDKQTGAIYVASMDQVSSSDVSALSADQVTSLSNYRQTASRSKGIFEDIGECGFPYIDDHLYAGIAMETPKNPNKYATSTLAGMICAAIGVSTPIPGDSILFGGFCSAVATAVQELVFDTTFTAGGWDSDGWVPEIKAGVSGEYDADYTELTQVQKAPGHIDPLT